MGVKVCSRCHAPKNAAGLCPFKCEEHAKPRMRANRTASKQTERERRAASARLSWKEVKA